MRTYKTVYVSLAFIACAFANQSNSAAFAQSTFAKSPTGLATRVQATQGQEAAATAQSRCVELIKAQSTFERNIANYNAKIRDLDQKSKSLTQTASVGRGSDKCKVQSEQADVYRDTANEHSAYLDNIAESIKNCPSSMTEKLAGAQFALKKSQEVLEKVIIGTEGALISSCR